MNEALLRPRFLFLHTKEQIVFFKRLALYLRAGTPLLSALIVISNESGSTRSSYIFTSISEHVRSGRSLASSLEMFPGIFRPFVSSLVHTGEESGHLQETLLYVADILEKQRELKQKVQSALIYPSIVVVATLAIAVFLTTYAFPKIIPLFRGFKTALPLSTRMLIAVSDFFVHYGMWVLLALVLTISVVVTCRSHPYIRSCYEYLSIRIPVVGALVRAHHLASTSRILATLLKGGTSLVRALELTRQASSRDDIRRVLLEAKTQVSSGKQLSSTLSHSPLFTQVWVHLVRTGESTGTLPENLTALAEISEQELHDTSRLLATLIEPLLMVVIGLIVGFIALAIITPLYQITQDIKVQ